MFSLGVEMEHRPEIREKDTFTLGINEPKKPVESFAD